MATPDTSYGATKRRSVTLTYGSTRVLRLDREHLPHDLEVPGHARRQVEILLELPPRPADVHGVVHQ